MSVSAPDTSQPTAKDSSHLPLVDNKKTLSIVNLQQTSIAPKESVTYEKQTQTIGQNTERGGTKVFKLISI